MNTIKKVCYTSVVFLVTCCTGGCYTTTPGQIEASGAGGSAVVEMHTLPDGTRCAVLVGYQKGGITCDWESTRKPNNEITR